MIEVLLVCPGGCIECVLQFGDSREKRGMCGDETVGAVEERFGGCNLLFGCRRVLFEWLQVDACGQQLLEAHAELLEVGRDARAEFCNRLLQRAKARNKISGAGACFVRSCKWSRSAAMR